jgi:hypothetical protein
MFVIDVVILQQIIVKYMIKADQLTFTSGGLLNYLVYY